MGCGVNVRILPLPAQRAIKAKATEASFILSLAQYDQNYEWYCITCNALHESAIRSLTLNFDAKIEIPRI